MTPNIRGCLTLVIVSLGISSTTPISIEQLDLESEATVRQVMSAEIRKYLNESADPCEDFHEFTCGKMSTDKYQPVDIINILKDDMMHKMKKELELTRPYIDTDIDWKLKMFYSSCVYVYFKVNRHRETLKDIIKEFGQMPVLEGETWQQNDFDWQSTLGKMIYKTGLKILFNIGVAPDMYDNTVNRVSFSQPSFELDDISLYVDESLTGRSANYKASIGVKLRALLGVPKELAERTAQEILDFEISLARGMRDKKQGVPLPKIYFLKSIEELQTKYLPIWDTKKLIGDAMGFIPNEVVVQSSYLDHAFEVMRNASAKDVANYIFYKYISSFMIDWVNSYSELDKFCVEKTKEILYKPLMNLIYRTYFTEQMKKGVEFMWLELKLAFEKALLSSPRLQWMTADTRQYAVKKLKAMKLQILSFEHTNFSILYNDLKLSFSVGYVKNVNEVLTFNRKIARESFNKPPEPYIVPISSPFNIVEENTVKIPIDILQPFHVWSSSYPYAYNFATLGFLIAHEIVHNFDDLCRDFDINGNALHWWDDESKMEFLEHSKCFVNQYKSYSYGGRPMPEIQSQRENIADNGGLRLAYEAYLSWLEKQKNKKDISAESFPDLDYNNKQLFFISYGKLLCASVDPGSMVAEAASNIHAPMKFRVIGVLSNIEEFSKEFNCPLGSGMNPVEKCVMY